MRRAVWGATGLAAVFACACQLIAGLHDVVVSDDAGGTDADTPDVNACNTIGVPLRLPDAASSPTDPIDTVFALTAVDFGFNPDGGPPASGPYGLNLDETCTCPGNDSCIRPTGQAAACDVPPTGIDNNGNVLFLKAQELQFVTQSQLNQALQTGQSGCLIHVQGYNGQTNDSTVALSVFSSLGIESPLTPLFDGNDRWLVDDVSVASVGADGGAIPAYTDTAAYVTNGSVVGTLEFPVTIGSASASPVTIELAGGRVFAQLGTNSTGQKTLSGIFAGRWEAKKMLSSFQSFQDPFYPANHVCGMDPTYMTLQTIVCNLVDIMRDPGLDNANNNCDSLSVGIHFDAVEAKLGTVTAHPDGGAPCGQGWVGSCP